MTKPSRWLGRLPGLYLPLLLLFCATLAWRPLGGGDDFWSHAAIGRWIWQHHAVPHQTLFLWSTRPIPYIAHSWLTELLFYYFLTFGGTTGAGLALVFNIVMSALPFLVLWLCWASRERLSCLHLLVFALAMYCSSPRFQPRQELLSAFFLVALLQILIRWTEGVQASRYAPDELRIRSGPTTARLLVLVIAWTNCHGAVGVGLVMIVATVAAELVQERLSRRSMALAGVAAVALLGVLANPYGLDYLQVLRRPAASQMFSQIIEWKPFWGSPPLGAGLIAGETGLFLLALASWIQNRERRLAQLLWLLLMAAAFLTARRYLWMLNLVSLTVLAANPGLLDTEALWRTWRRFSQSKVPPAPIPAPLRLLARGGAMATVLVWGLVLTPHNLLPLRPTSVHLPLHAAAFVDTNRIEGRMFNDYENSSFLEWWFGERRPLFIDLVNAYPDQIMVNYLDIIQSKTRGQRMLSGYHIDFIVLRHYTSKESMSQMGKFLNGNPGWACVYGAADGTIWLRREPRYAGLIRKYQTQPPAPSAS